MLICAATSVQALCVGKRIAPYCTWLNGVPCGFYRGCGVGFGGVGVVVCSLEDDGFGIFGLAKLRAAKL